LPGRDISGLSGVSNAGHVVGSSSFSQGSPMSLPFIWTEARGMVAIPLVPGTDRGGTSGVNSAGWVVGWDQNITSPTATTVPHLYDGTSTCRLGDLIPANTGWDLQTAWAAYAMGISDDGVILGVAGLNGEVHTFAMIPVPEPASTFGLMSVAVAAAAVWRRRR